MTRLSSNFLKFALVLIIAAFLLSSPCFSQEKTEKHVLKNGITVLLRENHSVPVVAFIIVYRVGSRNEQLGTTGISHLLEHMLFRGTERFPPGEIGKTLDVLGAEYNAFTTYDITGYYETLPPEHLPLAMEIEADRMLNSKLDASILEQEKTVVLSELEGDENSPLEVLGNEVQSAHFTAHPYHWPIGGFKDDVRGLAREDVYSYYKANYYPQNTVISIVGDVDSAKTLGDAEKYFGQVQPGKIKSSVRSIEPPQRCEKRIVIREKGKTSYLKVAFHTPSLKDRDIYSLAVMESILAEGKSSRLYRALVEKGLATSISSSLWDNIDPGMYSITITLAPGKSHKDVEEELFREIESFSVSRIRSRERQKAENRVKAGFFGAKDSLTLLAEYLAWYEALDSYEYLDNYLENIRKVKESDILAVARKYLRKSACTIGWYCALSESTGGTEAQDFAPGRVRFARKITSANAEVTRFAHNTPFKEEIGGKEYAMSESSGKEPPRKWEFSFSRFVLPNGLTVIVKENHSNPTVTVSGYVRAGSIFDPEGKEGLSNFTASMLERGTTTRSFQEIAESFDFLGAHLSFGGSREVVEIDGWTLSENLDEVMELFSDCLLNSQFPSAEKDKVYREIVAQINRQLDDPQTRALITLREMIYPSGHPYNHNMKGCEATLGNIKAGDLRDFHKKYFRPDNTVLVFVGDVKADVFREKVEKYFGKWKAAGAGQLTEVAIPDVELPAKEEQKVISMEGRHQVYVAMGNKGMSRGNRDYYAFDLLNAILGGNTLTSRLGTILREKEGLVYGVWSYMVSTKGESPWIILYGTNEKDVRKSLDSARAVIKEIQTNPVSDEELRDAKSTVINKLAVSLETNAQVAQMLCDIEYFGLGSDYVEKIPEIYSSITSEDLLKAARKYIHLDRLITVIGGPYKEK